MTVTDALPANMSLDDRQRIVSQAVTSVEELREINGEPRQLIAEKATDYLTPLLADFINKCPYYLLATSAADGSCDVSPRGDAAGAVHILDARTIALPDRPGNRRIDSLLNIVSNPHVGLLFVIPAVDETIRLNGRATITKDPELLESMQMQGKTPKLAILVDIDQVFVHCARSILRAGLWNPQQWPDPDTIPTLAAMLAEQKNLPAPDEGHGNKRNEEYRSVLY